MTPQLRYPKSAILLLVLLLTVIAHAGPAVRVGDRSEHGGEVTTGLVGKVRINGLYPVKPTDMHVCPLVTGIVPHVGGPVTGPPLSSKTRVLGVSIVLDGALATCVGAIDKILGGSPNVRINK